MFKWGRRATAALRVTAVVLVISLWYLVTIGNSSLESLALPSPGEFLIVISMRWPELLMHTFVSSIRVMTGFVLAGIVGLLTRLAMYASTTFRAFADSYVELIRPVPPVALSPFFILWFGLGETVQLLLIGLTSFLVICVSTYSN